MKRIRILIPALVVAGMAVAQTTYEAAEMLGTDLIGSARYVGMGGAMSAFGNDLSIISKNPAGIGLYTTNDVMTTLSFSQTKTFVNDSFGRENKTNSPVKAGLDNMAFVMVNPLSDKSSLNFAFAYHKNKDQKYTMTYNDMMSDDLGYTIWRDFENNVRSRTDQYDFNVSMNVNDNVYWGVTFGILSSQYRSDGYFYDYYPRQTDYPSVVDNYSYDGHLDFDGAGWNMTLGLIMRSPTGHSRLGFSVQTPTVMHVNTMYEDFLYAAAGQAIKQEDIHLLQETTYNVRNPWIFNISTGFSGEHSALGFEYELVDANQMSMTSGRSKLRDQVNDKLLAYSTFRVGYEANIDKMSFRIGYNSSSPLFRTQAYKFLEDTDFNYNRNDCHFNNLKTVRNITLGVGYCSAPGTMGEQYYVDGAYVYTTKRSDFSLGSYPVGIDQYDRVINYDSSVVEFSNNGHRFVLSVGCCF
ncbi:MAG: hypothetical protein MJY79_00455 [Bacteroidaceae bacterium]|nr:hypothetical protein [Bacteroidaceae bacterium]